MAVYDFLIVGAGFYGAVFAHYAASAGKKCLVIDKKNHIGGAAFCEKQSAITVHKYGPHIFHTDREKIWQFIMRFAKFNNFVNSPLARNGNEIYNLPFNMNTYNKLWGVITPKEAKEKIAEQTRPYRTKKPSNLEEKALSLVGPDIYEKLIKNYTEKQWGRRCSELPPAIINRLPLRFNYDNNYFNDVYQGIPAGGYNGIFEKLLKGCELQLSTDFFSTKKLVSLADSVVYTGMIDEYFDYRYGALEYRTLTFVTEEINTENFQGNAVVNYTDAETPYTRIVEHKHFAFGKQPTTVITREYPGEWQAGREPLYPVNDTSNNELYKRYRQLAEREKNVIFGGRLAEYRYYNMDEVIHSAMQTAEKIFSLRRGKRS
ncbi:UDP-galactopyranose mutase [Pyramidobacter sp. YE332]|uniref:UDP-galactopyranose mutase n=1 Tax=Pyramidobacter sp. YE332 TaxID=3068894 RepID=UPI00294B0BA8|nr:UDP-galactopyranose mutase [Pyramidobacter sp. YE332]WOL38952.1 UDP-galactopyranose mutase [Pyramidobacter sp. YE332]